MPCRAVTFRAKCSEIARGRSRPRGPRRFSTDLKRERVRGKERAKDSAKVFLFARDHAEAEATVGRHDNGG